MTRRFKALLFVGLALSLIGNLFQALWAGAEDVVVSLSRDEIVAKIDESRSAQQSSSAWSKVWVDSPELVILEIGDMINFRGLFGAHAKRVIYISSR